MSTSLGKKMVYAWTLQTPGQRVPTNLFHSFLTILFTINFGATVSIWLHIDESSN